MALDWKETSQWWYGRITTRTGKRKLINLGVKIEGRRPRSIVDQGDAAFERSRGKAIREHDRILSEIQNKQNLEELTQRVIELKTGSRVEAVKLEDLPDTWEQLPRPRATVPRYSNMVRSRLLRFAMFIPRRLLGRKKPTRQNISNLPLAGLVGEGKYMKSLGEASIRDGYDLKFNSFFGGFPQMFTSLVSGKFAAVLPEVAGHGLMLDNIIILKDLEFLKALDRVNAIVWNKRLAAFRQYLPHAADAIKKALKTPLP